METVCTLLAQDQVGANLSLALLGLSLILGLIGLFYFFHKRKIRGIKLFVGLPASIVSLLFASFFIFLSMITFQETFNQPIGSKYFAINGEIKLACLYPGDTNQRVCPKTKEQVLALDPGFKQLLSQKEWDYKYFPDSNEYTLIIKHDWFRGVIFDQLLKKLGYLDLVETKYTCAGNIVAYSVGESTWNQYKKLRDDAFPSLRSSSVMPATNW